LEQGSPEWLAARCGIVTASTVGNLITRQQPDPTEFPCADCESNAGDPCVALRGGKPMKTVHDARKVSASAAPARLVTANNDTSHALIMSLAAERITGEPFQIRPNSDMQRGTEYEPHAREHYAENYAPVVELGFCTEDKWGAVLGCSPDGLVGDEGGIEIKSPRPKTHLATILADQVPAQYMPQCQTFLLVTGRKWIDFVSFSPGMPLWPKRIEPDPAWFTAIAEALVDAEQQINAIVAQYEKAVEGLPPTERIPDFSDIEVA